MNLLEVPAIFSGLCLDGDDGCSKQIVAFAIRGVVRRTCVARGKVNEPKVRIDCRRLPDRGATELVVIVVLRPGVAAELTGRGDCVESPQKLAVFGAVRFHTAANAHVRTTEAGDDHALVVERRADDGIA